MRRISALMATAAMLVGVPGVAHGEPAEPVTGSSATPAVQAAGLAPTPPMGWNSWNRFHCDINEKLIRQTADAMVASGMRDAGYEYVNIDDCWMAPTRDEQGRLQADPKRFPSGIEALADYVHARGLKLGIYSSAGTKTCQGLPASLGHEEVDAQTFAEWGVDYLKYDNCHNQGIPAKERYAAMGEALAKTGRPIVYALCEWGSNDPWLWGDEVGADLWRTTGDISDSWSSVMALLDQQVGLEGYAGPHGWNDPDMLEVGNGGMTSNEYRAHMSLWALLNAPLLAGNDLRSMSPTTLRTLTDPDVIAVNQDWGGEQGSVRRDDGDTEVWAKPMSDGSVAVVLLNRDGRTRTISASPSELELPASQHYVMQDLWTDKTTGTTGTVRAAVPSHGVAMFVVRPAPGGNAAPAVTLDANLPEYVERGAPVTVSTSLYNDGSKALTNGDLGLAVPDGWTVSPAGPRSVPVVAPGDRVSLTWTLTADGGRGPETVAVDARARWRAVGETHHATTRTSFATANPIPPGDHFVSDLAWVETVNGWGPVERDTSNGERAAGDGNPITIAGTSYEKGLGVHAVSSVRYFAGGDCSRFEAYVGVDDEEAGLGSVAFEVWADDTRVAATRTRTGGQEAVALTADVGGAALVELRVSDGGDGVTSDHGDWADARISCG